MCWDEPRAFSTSTGIVQGVGLIDDIRTTGYRDDGRGALAVPGARRSLADVATEVARGSDLLAEARDFLDVASRADDTDLAMLTSRTPPSVDARTDALLAALAEHVLSVRGLATPAWGQDRSRFLDRFWFVSDAVGLRATAVAETPIALKRRGIFWPARSLERV